MGRLGRQLTLTPRPEFPFLPAGDEREGRARPMASLLALSSSAPFQNSRYDSDGLLSQCGGRAHAVTPAIAATRATVPPNSA